MSRIENGIFPVKNLEVKETKSALQTAAETLQTLMRDGGYAGYTVTVTAESVSIAPPNSIAPPPRQSI